MVVKCPYCGHEESKVIDSRPTDEGERIRRRRECLKCGRRFTTYEVIETVPLLVIKKDRSREAFDRNKLMRGLLRACEKRPVSMAKLEQVVDGIEAKLQNTLDREISSSLIGEYAMEALKDLPAGSVIEVLTDCPQAFIAIPDDVAREGHELVVPPERTGPNSRFLIRTHRR